MNRFQIAAAPRVLRDGAVAAAIDELTEVAQERRIATEVTSRPAAGVPKVAIGGRPRRALPHPDAFRIRPARGNLLIEGGSPRGQAMALFWLADRLRVEGRLPSAPVERAPVFDVRYAHLRFPTAESQKPPYVDEAAMARAMPDLEDDLRRCLMMGITHVTLSPREVVVPCDHPVHGRRAEAYAPFLEEVLRMAHALHIKVLAMGDEFLYHPGALKEAGATLSVEDPAFWRMLKNKYRRLLKRFPDLDGVAMRIGEMLPLGPFLAFDVIHDAPQLSVAEKYRRFVTALHDVVVGEFGKFYLHRTWAVSEHEVHSQPKEFLAAFREVPRENLLLSIKLTQTDQWQFQAYNPTFGLTDHQTAVEIEIGRGYHHRQEIPDYIVPWVEPGLRYVRSRGATGIAIGAVVKGAQTWADASAYAVSRLAWGDQDVRQLARDWSAVRFGKRASKPMGDALMLSDLAMRKSLYLLPYAATHAWDPQAYFMAYRWAVGGNPTLDGGLGHMAFLREFYWYCQPYLSDTERELDEGMGLWDEMMALLAKAEPKIEHEDAREWARQSFNLGEGFLALNAAYLKAMLRYFRYEETLSARDRQRARAALRAIKPAMKQYAQAGGYYGTAAITLFMACAARGLRSARAAQAMLTAPSQDDLQAWIEETMAEEARLLRRAKRRVKVLEYHGEVDGREVIRLRGERLTSATDKGEPARAVRCQVCGKPPKGWRVVMKPIRCRDYTYVVEQPSRANKWTVLFCIDDAHDGSDIYEVEMYAIPGK